LAISIKEIKASGGKAKAVKADTSVTADAERTVKAALDTFGDINILVNNAGIYRFMPAIQMTEEMWQKTININLTGSFFFAKAAANAMIKAGHGGKIVNIASIDAFRPTGNLAHYDASKGGVVMMTKALGQELAQYGINVNAVAPGGINTPGVALMMGDAKMTREKAEAMNKEFINKMPLHRMGEPDDIAKVVLFLVSGAADYMVGSTVKVDGGALLV
jgi:2-deoxy-D-gluconate 3-dehydrogenase